jgi:hypothetical protein
LKQQKKVKVDPGAAVLPTTNNTLIHQQERHQNQVVWAKVRIAKAMEQNSNVTSRLGRVEELENIEPPREDSTCDWRNGVQGTD